MIESANFTGMVIGKSGSSDALTLQSNATSSRSFSWKRVNTRLLDWNTDQTTWKQEWTISVVSPGGHDAFDFKKVLDNENDVITCYEPNPAFSTSFDDYAKGLVISDASNEDQCRQTREKLGFDKDYSFDTEVCDKFKEQLCDPLFTGVDHKATLLGREGFETVEYTPVEYEAVEYEAVEYETIDYEEFTK
jgi:hypothetical protein